MIKLPTLHVTNFASRKAPHRGPGRVYGIMAAPRQWEQGDGRVQLLAPELGQLRAIQAGLITVEQYRRRYLAKLQGRELRPGLLLTHNGARVADGDTLCCSCSREAAAEGRCHRVWAAERLVWAGWRVILDGVELPQPETAPYRPSNGTVGESFRNDWCDRCGKDSPSRPCSIFGRTLFHDIGDPEYPEEWQEAPSSTDARCTAFEARELTMERRREARRGRAHRSAERAGQVSLFDVGVARG